MKKILATRDAMKRDLFPVYVDSVCEGDKFEIFVDDVKAMLPSTARREAVRDSLTHLAGERMTAKSLGLAFWRLAGNMKRLSMATRESVGPWVRQPAKEWVPVQVVGGRRRRNSKGAPGYLFQFLALAGRPCGLTLTRFWTDRFCGYMRESLGFRNRVGERSQRLNLMTYKHPTELVTLRLYVLVDPALCGSEPGFEKTHVPPSCVEWNHEQMRYRDRLPVKGHPETKYDCPFNVPLTVACYMCPKGYVSCRAGCHRNDYTFDYCTVCNSDNVAYDAALSDEMCIDCYEHRAMQRK